MIGAVKEVRKDWRVSAIEWTLTDPNSAPVSRLSRILCTSPGIPVE